MLRCKGRSSGRLSGRVERARGGGVGGGILIVTSLRTYAVLWLQCTLQCIAAGLLDLRAMQLTCKLEDPTASFHAALKR